MQVTQIYTGPDKRSYFRDLTVPTATDPASGRQVLEYLPSAGTGVSEGGVAGASHDWHNAPRRQFGAGADGRTADQSRILCRDGPARRRGA